MKHVSVRSTAEAAKLTAKAGLRRKKHGPILIDVALAGVVALGRVLAPHA